MKMAAVDSPHRVPAPPLMSINYQFTEDHYDVVDNSLDKVSTPTSHLHVPLGQVARQEDQGVTEPSESQRWDGELYAVHRPSRDGYLVVNGATADVAETDLGGGEMSSEAPPPYQSMAASLGTAAGTIRRQDKDAVAFAAVRPCRWRLRAALLLVCAALVFGGAVGVGVGVVLSRGTSSDDSTRSSSEGSPASAEAAESASALTSPAASALTSPAPTAPFSSTSASSSQSATTVGVRTTTPMPASTPTIATTTTVGRTLLGDVTLSHATAPLICHIFDGVARINGSLTIGRSGLKNLTCLSSLQVCLETCASLS